MGRCAGRGTPCGLRARGEELSQAVEAGVGPGHPASRRRSRAVSPVVAEVLMVSITIVMVGILSYYLMSLPHSSETIQPALGTRINRGSGQWTLEVVSGNSEAVSTRIQVVDPATGAATFSSPVRESSPYFRFNDNNANMRVDGGDSFLLNETTGYVEVDFRVLLTIENSILAGPITLIA
ncbi:MAG: type IV pilin [Thermoplasmatota archaeon]